MSGLAISVVSGTISGIWGLETIIGSNEDDVILGGDGFLNVYGRDGDDAITGGDGGGLLAGGNGDDEISGGGGTDSISGGAGDDMIESGPGTDFVVGGAGNDSILSLSWGGEPGAEVADDDIIIGGAGEDTFTFRWLMDAREEILAEHTDKETGDIDYAAVAEENDAYHDNWITSMGDKTVADYNADEDTLVFEGNSVALASVELIDADGDDQIDDTLLTFVSDQGGSGAHHGDALGTVTVLDATIAAEDVVINSEVYYGVDDAFSMVG